MEEKKKLKVWPIILGIVLIVLVVGLGNLVRKVFILDELEQKMEYINENKANLYVKYENEKVVAEKYRKTEKKKLTAKYKEDGRSQIIFTSGQEGLVAGVQTRGVEQYEEKDGKKTVRKLEKVTADIEMIYTINGMYGGGLRENIQLAIGSKISSGKVDEKDCYIIQHKDIYPQEEEGYKTVRAYLEKETGLLLKVVAVYPDREETTNYEYSFDTVTDEDFKKPEGYEEVK